jgi:hypothetical protein
MNVFADEATEERGENARLSSFVGAMALGDLVKSTLGPKVSVEVWFRQVPERDASRRVDRVICEWVPLIGNEQDSSYALPDQERYLHCKS